MNMHGKNTKQYGRCKVKLIKAFDSYLQTIEVHIRPLRGSVVAFICVSNFNGHINLVMGFLQ